MSALQCLLHSVQPERIGYHNMRHRTLLALALAPLASGLLQGALMQNVGAFLFGLVFAYLFAILIGLPARALLRRIGWNSLSKFILG